eukprot:4166334-Pleurochrysis_carterae.AAC.1
MSATYNVKTGSLRQLGKRRQYGKEKAVKRRELVGPQLTVVQTAGRLGEHGAHARGRDGGLAMLNVIASADAD